MPNLKKQYESLKPDAIKERIEKTAQDLGRRNFMPSLLLNVDDFFYMTRERMMDEYNRVMNLRPDSEEIKSVVALSNPDEIKEKHLRLLLNYYFLLCRLREGESEAWDTINELYEDD